MTDVELLDLLSQFEDSAKQLNTASDSINNIITDIEHRLVKANAGLECWVEDLPLESTEPVRIPANNDAGDSLYSWHETILGFAKLNQTEGWRLVTRERVAYSEEAPYGDDPPTPDYDNAEPDALWKAPRNLRIKALEMMPTMVKRLKKATDDALKAISAAKKIAG